MTALRHCKLPGQFSQQIDIINDRLFLRRVFGYYQGDNVHKVQAMLARMSVVLVFRHISCLEEHQMFLRLIAIVIFIFASTVAATAQTNGGPDEGTGEGTDEGTGETEPDPTEDTGETDSDAIEDTPEGDDDYYSDYGPDEKEFSSPSRLQNSTTNWLARSLATASVNCLALEPVYQFDCFRQHYKKQASRLEDNAAYAVPKQALRDLEDTLDTILAENTDPTVPPLRKGNKTYQAIRPTSVPEAAIAFNQALDEASTMLLRSSSDNAGHFDRIADALGSNKILLRSALLQLCPAKLEPACSATQNDAHRIA